MVRDESANGNIREALSLAGRLCRLADKGETECLDDGCAVLFGVVRDCGYTIMHRAQKEREDHVAHGRWRDVPPRRGGTATRGGRKMKTRGMRAVLAALLAAGAASAAEGWLTDFEAAKREAARRGVPILADFSGSDWCGWCMKLDREVFSTAVFKEYAGQNLVLFVADFPQRKPQPEDVAARNKALAAEYGVRGFPTVLLLGADGKELARTGYRPGGPEAYVDHLKALLAGAGTPVPRQE